MSDPAAETIIEIPNHDETHGYREMHEISKRRLKRRDDLRDFDLNHMHYDPMRLLSEQNCQAIRTAIDHVYETGAMIDPDLYLKIFSSLITDELDLKLRSYFQSEYMPTWINAYRHEPSDQNEGSFFWHCDSGPSTHLKILLYLNATSECGASTQFLDYETTQALKEEGKYIYGTYRARDLTPQLKEIHREYKPFTLNASPGTAMLFNPMQVLHMGVCPTMAPRYTMQFCIVPAPMPWKEAARHFPIPSTPGSWLIYPKEMLAALAHKR